MLRRVSCLGLAGAASAVLFVSESAFAHVGFTEPYYANQTQVLKFLLGHGCEGVDSSSIEITLPSDVSSVRVTPSTFGSVEVKKNDAGVATSVIWTNTRPSDADDRFYELLIRAKLPDAPFSTLLFPAKQICKGKDGNDVVVNWSATPEEVAAAKEGEEPSPAPSVLLLPARMAGWNKFTVKEKLSDLTAYPFGRARG